MIISLLLRHRDATFAQSVYKTVRVVQGFHNFASSECVNAALHVSRVWPGVSQSECPDCLGNYYTISDKTCVCTTCHPVYICFSCRTLKAFGCSGVCSSVVTAAFSEAQAKEKKGGGQRRCWKQRCRLVEPKTLDSVFSRCTLVRRAAACQSRVAVGRLP